MCAHDSGHYAKNYTGLICRYSNTRASGILEMAQQSENYDETEIQTRSFSDYSVHMLYADCTCSNQRPV